MTAILFSSSIAFAGVDAYQGSTKLGVVEKVSCSTGMTCTASGKTLTVTANGAGVISGGTIDNTPIAAPNREPPQKCGGFSFIGERIDQRGGLPGARFVALSQF